MNILFNRLYERESEREIPVENITPYDSGLTDQEVADQDTWTALLVAYRKLKAGKPEDRSEKARRYAVTITEMEKAIAYFDTMVVNGFEG